ETLLWESGVTDAPLPPLADAQDINNATDPFLELYQKLGPIYRLARQDEKPLVVLAGAEANAFTSRYGDEFFVSAELWKDFNFELDPPHYQLTRGQQLTIEDDVDGSSGKQLCLKVAARRQ